MKKVQLHSDLGFDFHLIGLISSAREYTVCWSINESLGLELSKQKDLEVILKNDERQMVSNYVYEDDYTRYTLIWNKAWGTAGAGHKVFLASLSQFDYLLKIEEYESTLDLSSIIDSLRKAQRIDTMMKLDVGKIKEKESLIF